MPKNPKFPRTGSYVRSLLFPSLELFLWCWRGQSVFAVRGPCQWEVGAASEALDRTAGFASIRRISRLKL